MSETDDNRLVDYLYGEMESADMRAFEDAMQDDPQLSESVQGLESMLENIRTLEVEEAPGHLDSLIMAHAREQTPEPSSWLSRFFARPNASLIFSGACALVLAVVLIPQMSTNEGKSGLEVAPSSELFVADKQPVEKKVSAKAMPKVEEDFEEEAVSQLMGRLGTKDEVSGGSGLGTRGRGGGGDLAGASDEGIGGLASAKSSPKRQPVVARSARKRRSVKRQPVEIASAAEENRPGVFASKESSRAARRIGSKASPSAPAVADVPAAAVAPKSTSGRSVRPSSEAGSDSTTMGFAEANDTRVRARSSRPSPRGVESARKSRKSAPKVARSPAAPMLRGGAVDAEGPRGASTPDREAWARDLARTAQKKAKALIREKRIAEARRIYLDLRPAVRGTMAFFELSLWLAQLEYGQGRYLAARQYAQEASRSRDQRVQNKAREVVARVREDESGPDTRPAGTTDVPVR